MLERSSNEPKPIFSIKPYEKNPRRNADAVKAVKASIEKFGFKVPIVIDKGGVIVAGHTRLEAAKRLGLDKVPCVVADDLTPEQVKAFRLADNKTAEMAEWDAAKLAEELADISDFDMQEFGFDSETEPINDNGVEEKTVREYRLHWEKNIVPMTEDECRQLTAALEKYVEEAGVSFGFVGSLLCNMNQ